MDQRRQDIPAAFSNLLMPNTGTTPYYTAPRRDEGHYNSPSSPGPRVPAYALAQLDTSGSPRSSPTHSRASAGSNSTPRTTGLTLKPIQRVPSSSIAFSDPNTNNNNNAQHVIQYITQTSDSNSYSALLKKLKAKERVAPLNRSDLDDPMSARGPLRNGQQLAQIPHQANTPTPPPVGRYRSPSLQQRRRSMPDSVARGGALRMNEASPTPNRRLSQPRVLVRPPPGPARLAAAGYGSDGGYGSDRSRAGGESPSLSAAEGAQPQQRRKGRIRVVVRKRPVPTGEEDVVEVDPPIVHVNAQKVRIDLSEYTEAYQYGFDDAFAEDHNNAFVYKQCGMPLIDTVFEGGSASCFAYGQTGSGKTHTMLGTESDMGFYLLAAKDIFDRCTGDHKVSVSMFEIYCNSLFDLFNARSVVIPREDSSKRVVICGLTWQDITSVSNLAYWIDRGSEQRRTGSTSANEYSSRSHAVMTISVRNERERVYGSLKLVDLAGSERAADTAAHDKQTRLEGAEINKSLLALKECIRGLDERKKHIPFRGSKLTEVLRDSFEGNSRTVMIAAVTPAASSVLHTLNTLRYAFRVKGLSIDQNVVPSKQRKSRLPPARSKSTDPTAPYSILAQPLPPLYLTPAAAAAAANRDRSPSARLIEREKERDGRRVKKHRKTRSRTMDPSSGGSGDGSPLGSNDAILALQVQVGAEIAGLRQEMMGVITKKDEEISRLNQKNEDLEMKLERLLEHIANKETALEREQEHAYN